MSANFNIAARRFAAIAFDLDGTLLDTVPDSHAALNRVFQSEGLRALTLDEVRTTVGEGAPAMVRRAVLLAGERPSETRVDALVEKYLAAYLADPAGHTTVYEGAIDALSTLQASGYSLAICTNKPRITTRAVLATLGLGDYFEAVMCPEDVTHRKPDGRHLIATFDALGKDARHGAFVGDSETDIAAAADAKVPSVLVTWGYSHRPLESLTADAVIDRFQDLPLALRRLESRFHS